MHPPRWCRGPRSRRTPSAPRTRTTATAVTCSCPAGSRSSSTRRPSRGRARERTLLELPEQVHEDAAAAVAEVGEVVREIGEVVAHAHLEVLAHVVVAGREQAALALAQLARPQRAQLQQPVV